MTQEPQTQHANQTREQVCPVPALHLPPTLSGCLKPYSWYSSHIKENADSSEPDGTPPSPRWGSRVKGLISRELVGMWLQFAASHHIRQDSDVWQYV